MTPERILLRMEGQPQEASEAVVLALDFALKFCAQPGIFPGFLAFAQDAAGFDWVLDALSRLKPEVLEAIRTQIAAGVAADFEGAE